MMRFFYDIGIRLYYLAAWVLSLWNRKARLWISGRRGWRESLEGIFREDERVAWFHCSSLGEFEQGRPMMEAFRKRCPEHRILLTFFSPSGYEKRKDYPLADHVMYLPLDTARNARCIVRIVHPELAVFIKYEFWYHFLRQLNRQEVPVYLASAIFRPQQMFFRWYGAWYLNFLHLFTRIFVQQESSAELLKSFGIGHVAVAGDTRFDRVARAAETPFDHPALEELTRGRFTLVAGSTWEKDEQLLEYAYRELPEELCWIIAPHEPSEARLQKLRDRFPGSCLLSALGEDSPQGTRVVIVDSIGQLSFLYRYGNLAYIGGGFGKGIHNTLEPAAYSIPVIIGPRHQKFLEAVELVREGGAFAVLDEKELLLTVHQQLNNNRLLKRSSRIAGTYVKTRLGATSAIMDALCKN